MTEMISKGNIGDMLFNLRRRGIRLWVQEGRLCYQAPKGVVTEEEMKKLRTRSAEIIAFFSNTTAIRSTPQQALGPRDRNELVPLTYSQLSHWHVYQLDRRPSKRSIYFAIRVSGRLDVEILEKSLTGIIARHESLRTRIVSTNGTPIQVVDSIRDCRLTPINMSQGSRAECESYARQLVSDFINQPIDIASNSLCAWQLIHLAEYNYILVIAMDHLIADGASVGVLLRELFRSYAELAQRRKFSPPEITQFPDYAVWQRKALSSWARDRISYWHQHLARAKNTPLFTAEAKVASMGQVRVPVHFDAALLRNLRELSRRSRTTLAMGVLSVYFASLFHWKKHSDWVISFTNIGRFEPGLESAVGFFSSRLFLRVIMSPDVSFMELLQQVSSEYGNAIKNDDFGKMVVDLPWDSTLRNVSFNWFPSQFQLSLSPDNSLSENLLSELSNGDIEMTVYKVDPTTIVQTDVGLYATGRELGVAFSETPDGLVGVFGSNSRDVNPAAVEKFKHAFVQIARRLCDEPNNPLATFRRKNDLAEIDLRGDLRTS